MALLAALMRRAAAQRARGRRVATRLPRAQQPDLIRGRYLVGIRHAIAPMKRAVDSLVKPVMPALLESARRELERADSGEASRARAAVERAQKSFFSQLRDLRRLGREAAEETSTFQKAQLQRQLRQAVRVEVPIRDAKLGPKIETFTERNVKLVTSIPQRYFSELEGLVLDAVEKGQRWETLAELIDERFDVGESRAKTIASDQVGKFYADLSRARQESLGITQFIWRTDRDERVCPICGPLEGETFTWANAPEGGPGHAHPNCRCYAEPDLEQLLDDLEAS